MVVSEGDLDEDGIPVVVLAKKSAFTPEEEAAVREHLENRDLAALYLPSEPGDNAFSHLIASNDPYAFARQYAYNVAPVNDNAPFFFFTVKLSQLFHQAGLQQGIDWKVNLGVAVLGMVLLISLLAVVAFLIVPLAVGGGGGRHHAMRLLYFIAVGLGYILVEIAFIQRFVLFLGHPTYALTVVVFLLLLASGGGSLASRQWLGQSRSAWLALLGIVAVLLLYVGILPGLLNALVGLPFVAKLLVSAVLVAPLGFAMGMPFPTGLKALASFPVPDFSHAETSQAGENAVEWAWAMNAASSVLGSVLAMVIAIQFGLNITLACGALAYFVALLLSGTLRRRSV
jgi:hypothetical protein